MVFAGPDYAAMKAKTAVKIAPGTKTWITADLADNASAPGELLAW
ncbi:hypothetical protein BH11PSE12_BH11PSE12_26880 [soil metagenome]